MNRRQFLFLTASVATAGCQTTESDVASATREPRTVNAGPVSAYAKDGVYSRFINEGFFIVRQGDKLFAVSSYCTHRKCKLAAESDHTFYCKCHGSTFDPVGHVTRGPARIDLPIFSTSSTDQGQLLVQVL